MQIHPGSFMFTRAVKPFLLRGEPCPTKYTRTGPLRLRISLAEPWRLPYKRKVESLGDSLQPGEQRQVGAEIPSGARRAEVRLLGPNRRWS